jgi:hypothetical protein
MMLLGQDSFRRSLDSGWGRASDGQQWAADANTPARRSAFSVEEEGGQIEGQQSGLTAYNAVLGPVATNVDITATVSLDSFGAESNVGIVARWQNTSTWYKAQLDGSSLILAKGQAGAVSYLATMPLPASACRWYHLRLRATGTRLQARAWPQGSAEPTTWLTVADTARPLLSGHVGIRALLADGQTASITSFIARSIQP